MSYSNNRLHFHTGGTCHGHPTAEACIRDAIERGWEGKVLEKEDRYTEDGPIVCCYSLINDKFSHWSEHGRFVATLKLEMKVIYSDV